MSFPAFNDLSSLTGPQQVELEQFVSYLQGYLAAQHKDDGSHAAVTADSLVTGTLKVTAPTSVAVGNVTGDLIPTIDRQYALGAFPTTAPNLPLTWKNVYIGSNLYLGIGSSGGVNPVAMPTWALALSGSGVTWQPAQTNQTVVWNNAAGTGRLTIIPDSIFGIFLTCAGQISAAGGYSEHSRTTRMGEWLGVGFNAANFTASGGGTWTLIAANQTAFKYMLVGKTLWVDFAFDNTAVNAATTTLSVIIPGGFTAADTYENAFRLHDNGTPLMGYAFVASGSTTIGFRKSDESNWTNSLNTTFVRGQIALEIQ